VIGNSDLWWTQYDTDFDDTDWLDADGYTGTLYSPSVVFGRYYGSPGLIAADFVDFDPFDQESDDVTYTDVTIQPGASYQWIFFYQMLSYDQSAGADPDPLNKSANAAVVTAAAAASDGAADEFGADLELTGRLARGLDADIAANWVIYPELADTGVDASGIAIGGAMLAAAGIAVVATRRRKASV
jgi:LPXTG-motif cell wall-anchored protein